MAIELSDSSVEKIVDLLIYKNRKVEKNESEKELRNTEELLKNYRLLKNHANVDIPRLKDDVPLSSHQLSLYSLLGYRARSKEMIIFIDKILDEYKTICQAGEIEKRRRWDVISNLYINPREMSLTQLSEKFHADVKTIKRDKQKAIKELSIMIFGLDSLNDMSK